MRIKTSNGLQVEGGVFRERECEGERGLVEDGRSQRGDRSGGLAAGEKVGGEVVEFAGAGGHGKGEIPAESDLRQKKVHGIPGFEAQGAEDFFRGPQVGAVHPGP